MNLSNKIIKAQDIKLTESKDKLEPRFIKINFQTKDKSEDIYKDRNKIKADIIAKRKEIKNAYDKAFSEGMREGINQEKQKLSMAMESVAKLIQDLKILKNEFFKNSEKEIIDLIFLIAKKVIHREVSTSKDIIIPVLRDTVKNISDREGVKIRLNPNDYRYIMEVWPDFLSKFCDMKNTLIEEDEEISQGGALIETDSGGIDARLDRQLDKIKETLIPTL
jgi:flagellar assembly protein FliH